MDPIITVQAPQSPSRQPSFVPVNFLLCRKKSRTVSAGFIFIEMSSLLQINLISLSIGKEFSYGVNSPNSKVKLIYFLQRMNRSDRLFSCFEIHKSAEKHHYNPPPDIRMCIGKNGFNLGWIYNLINTCQKNYSAYYQKYQSYKIPDWFHIKLRTSLVSQNFNPRN